MQGEWINSRGIDVSVVWSFPSSRQHLATMYGAVDGYRHPVEISRASDVDLYYLLLQGQDGGPDFDKTDLEGARPCRDGSRDPLE